MEELTVAAARPLDFLEALDVQGRPFCRTRRQFGLHARQVAGSQALTFRAGDALVCIGGLYPNPDGTWECWLAVGPAFKAHLRAVLRDLRADLDVASRLIGVGSVILAYIDPASVAGDRLAKRSGFRPCGSTSVAGHELRTWRRHT